MLIVVYSDPSEAANRGKTDFVILRDEKYKNKKKGQLLGSILKQLHSEELTGNIYKGQPGMDKDEEFRNSVSDADFVICAFETRKNISSTYCDQVSWSHYTKRRRGVDGCMIPVFCDMSAEEAEDLLDRHTDLAFLKLYVAAYTKDDDWLEPIVRRITTPSLGESETYIFLHLLYNKVMFSSPSRYGITYCSNNIYILLSFEIEIFITL